jgi:hypothetical protein
MGMGRLRRGTTVARASKAPGPSSRFTSLLVTGILVGISFLAVTPLPASAGQPDLSTVVLSNALPGMVASPPGITNGPLDQANVSLFNAGPSETAAIDRQLSDGNMTGYLRVWTQQPTDGHGAVIVAFAISDASKVAGFLGGFNLGVRNSGASTFSVPNISGASGFSDQITSSGIQVTVDAVTFARGNTIFCVELVTPSGDLAPSDAIGLAARQAAGAPGATAAPVTPSGSLEPVTHVVDEIVGGVVIGTILIGLVVLLIALGRRRKRRFAITTSYPGVYSHSFSPYGPSAAFAPLASYAPPAPSPMPIPSLTPSPRPGWYPEAGNAYQQRYWDGKAWTAHLRWNGSSWVDVPPVSHS